MSEKITEEPEEQNQNDENDNENNEQEDLPADEEGQDSPGETNLFEDFADNIADGWEVISDWLSGLFGGGGNDESGNDEQQNDEENEQEKTPVSLLFERPDGTILEIPYTELYDVEENRFSDVYALIDMFNIYWTSSGNGNGRCSDVNHYYCTAINEVRTNTILGAIDLRNKCQHCELIITGAAERGIHSNNGTHTHENGWKLDYSLNGSLTSYIETNFECSPYSRDPRYSRWSICNGEFGNVYLKEMVFNNEHWDVKYMVDYNFKGIKYE